MQIFPIKYIKDVSRDIKPISDTLFEIKNHLVKVHVKRGRTLITCDCINDTKFAIESPLCIHKLVVIDFILNNEKRELLSKLIKEYKNYKEMNLPCSVELFLDDLNKLKLKE